MLIENSFIDLLKTTPLRKITVTKLCENAQINRVTFYKHYLDVYDLYEKSVSDLIGRSAEEMKRRFEKNNLKDAIRGVFRVISENAESYRLLFSENVDSYYKSKSIETAVDKLSETDVKIADIGEREYAYLKSFLCFGGGGVLLAWLRGGQKESAEDAADFLYNFIRRLMATYSVGI